MAKLTVRLMAAVAGLALVFTAIVPADAAKARKHKKHPAAHAATIAAKSGYRGLDLFPAGPIYNGNDYLGDDPDPFIRSQIQRDVGVHYGGEN